MLGLELEQGSLRAGTGLEEMTPEQAEQYAEESWRKATPYILGGIVIGAALTGIFMWAVLRSER